MLFLLVAHAVVGAVVLLGARQLGRSSYPLAALPMAAAVIYVATQWGSVIGDGETTIHSAVWVSGLDLVADARLDGFAVLMALLVAGMGVVVMLYARSYFGPSAEGARIAGLLVLFAGSMLGLVLADNLGWLYVCWELTSITSYLLIGGSGAKGEQRSAALQALLVTGTGGLAMLGGFVIIAQEAGTWSLSAILADPPSGFTTGVGLGLVLAGIVTKSAQYPFHFWLPGAMVAPTPISAYLHSATMVKAGIYLAARFAPAFAATGVWRPLVITIGLVTMISGALRALRQQDLKLLLAFGTVSQLGFMFVLAGSGYPEATMALAVLLLAHGLFKGALFLVVGIVDHETGTRSLDAIPSLGAGWSVVRVVAIVSAASMAGLPPLVGFVAKESAYDAFAHGGWTHGVVLAGLVSGSVLTFAYSARFVRPFLRPDPARAPAGHAPGVTFVAPAAVLAMATVAVGLGVHRVLEDLIGRAANALDAGVGAPHLALWHGFNVPLLLSAVTVGAGILVVWARHRVAAIQARLAPPYRADQGFSASLRALNLVARTVTGVVQSGSQPVYIAVILLVVVGVPGISFLIDGSWPGWPRLAEVPSQVILAAVLIGCAIGVAVVRRRFAAVLLLGSVGYGMALVFAIEGAADLALTQFAVETLSVAVFMLVVRHLPRQFRPNPFRGVVVARLTIAAIVAVGVFGLAMTTTGGTDDRAVSEEIVELAEPEGGGTNVVNVILVDVRGLDTLGEITVLSVAGIGVVAIASIGRRSRREEEMTA